MHESVQHYRWTQDHNLPIEAKNSVRNSSPQIMISMIRYVRSLHRQPWSTGAKCYRQCSETSQQKEEGHGLSMSLSFKSYNQINAGR